MEIDIPITAPAALRVRWPVWAERLRRWPFFGRVHAVLTPTESLQVRQGTPQHTPSPSSLTAMTANLWHDWPRHRRAVERLERFAQLVEDQGADLLLLQEVWRTRHLRVDAWLAERLGMHMVYLRANGHRAAIGFEEGVAVLSRFPLRHADARQWADGKLARRVALSATVDTPWGEWLAVSAHLSLFRRRNAQQVLELQRWAAQEAGERPALIGGDFNADEHRPVIRQVGRTWIDLFRQAVPHGDRPTHEIRWPWGGHLHAARLDYLFLKPGVTRLRLEHAALLDSSHSDHRPVLARLVPLT